MKDAPRDMAPSACATLSIATDAGVRAKISIVNRSAAPIFVDRSQAALDGALENDLFAITPAGGPRVGYTGPLVKRGPPGPEGFVRLGPGESIETSIQLDRFYAFPPERRRYVVRFTSYQQPPDGSEPWDLESNEASFVAGTL